MDENEFQRLLSLFPVVRSRDFHADLVVASSSQLTSQTGKDEAEKWQEGWTEDGKKDNEIEDDFWAKLRLAAEKKVGEAEADKFCESVQKVYQKLVLEGLNDEEARKFINSH